MARALKMAVSGRRYITDSHSTANFVVEGHNRSHLRGQLAAVRDAVAGLGVEIPNTLPTVMRAQPFANYDMLHPDGRRQLPMHSILPHSRVNDFNDYYHAILKRHNTRMESCGVSAIAVYAAISTNGFLFEPVLMWSDIAEQFHRRHSSNAVLANVTTTEANEPARTLVAELKDEIIDAIYKCGGVHLQIGKAYPYTRDRDVNQLAALKKLRETFDPRGLFNPGAPGLDRLQ